MHTLLLSMVFGTMPCDRCQGDLNTDEVIDGQDLTTMLGRWGTANIAADINQDGIVDGEDMAIQLSNWGQCSCLCYEWVDCNSPWNMPNDNLCSDGNYPELLTLQRCPDLTGDRVCDGRDFTIFYEYWNAYFNWDVSDPNTPHIVRSCDLNGNDLIDVYDLVLIQLNFDRGY